jgi:hypothetical protein
MRIILYLLKYIQGNIPKSIRDIMVKLKSRSIYTMAKKGKNLGRNSSRRHCVLGRNSGVWAVFIGQALLVSADVTSRYKRLLASAVLHQPIS